MGEYHTIIHVFSNEDVQKNAILNGTVDMAELGSQGSVPSVVSHFDAQHKVGRFPHLHDHVDG